VKWELFEIARATASKVKELELIYEMYNGTIHADDLELGEYRDYRYPNL